ncbi:MAG: hypothetical protein SGI99_02225 [Pseudomonadota bacterium]|nr:hypothetical protein [Pseudomonadota bacterium]
MSRRRHLRWIALVALFGLLFQQVAMATYLCPIEQSGQSLQMQTSTIEHAPCHEEDSTDQARCEQHCHPFVTSADHATPLTVPAALPSEPWTLAQSRRQVASKNERLRSPISAHAAAPPLTIRHCTFQI